MAPSKSQKQPFHNKHGNHLSLKELVKNGEVIPLSNIDLQILTGNKCNVVLYEELGTLYPTLNDVLSNNARAIILYDLKGGTGHFVALSYHVDTNTLQFYNSYALAPDAEIDLFVHSVPVLSDMIRQFMQLIRVRLDVNPYQHQQFRENSNECGRHAVIRVLNSDMTNSQYHEFISGFSVQPPELVTLMTMSVNFLNKFQKVKLLE